MKSGAETCVFVSYSHKDTEWLDRLRVNLKPIMKAPLVLWSDTDIRPGALWKDEIAKALESARIAVLLVSADFLASDFITTHELPVLLAAAKKRGTVILPMIVKPSLFSKTPGLSDFQAVNPPSEPIIGMKEVAQEQVFVNVAHRISEIVAEDSSRHNESDLEPQEEEVPKILDRVFHPGDRFSTRSPLQRCSFFISPFFSTTHLWSRYGDIQVEIIHEPSPKTVYLIPSGAAPPHFRDASYLHTPEGRRIVARKREVAESFIKDWRNRELQGCRFNLSTTTGAIRTKVYSADYDSCLRAISDPSNKPA